MQIVNSTFVDNNIEEKKKKFIIILTQVYKSVLEFINNLIYYAKYISNLFYKYNTIDLKNTFSILF